jgi:small subunit ribosomal protein S20
MANIKSAYKRILVSERNRLRNKSYKSSVRTLIKKTLTSLSKPNKENTGTIKNLISLTYSKIDKAVQKGIIHPNNGNSKKSRIARYLKSYELNLREGTN